MERELKHLGTLKNGGVCENDTDYRESVTDIGDEVTLYNNKSGKIIGSWGTLEYVPDPRATGEETGWQK